MSLNTFFNLFLTILSFRSTLSSYQCDQDYECAHQSYELAIYEGIYCTGEYSCQNASITTTSPDRYNYNLIICDNDYACYGAQITCYGACFIHCKYDYSCANMNVHIQVPDERIASISCDESGISTCADTVIYIQNVQTFNIEAHGENLLNNMQVYVNDTTEVDPHVNGGSITSKGINGVLFNILESGKLTINCETLCQGALINNYGGELILEGSSTSLHNIISKNYNDSTVQVNGCSSGCANFTFEMYDTSEMIYINNQATDPVYLYEQATCTNCVGGYVTQMPTISPTPATYAPTSSPTVTTSVPTISPTAPGFPYCINGYSCSSNTYTSNDNIIICKDYAICRSSTFNLNSFSNIYCQSRESCQQLTINCNQGCNIFCNNDYSCDQLTINIYDNSNITCQGTDSSCKFANINIYEGNVNVEVDGNYGGAHIDYFVANDSNLIVKNKYDSALFQSVFDIDHNSNVIIDCTEGTCKHITMTSNGGNVIMRAGTDSNTFDHFNSNFYYDSSVHFYGCSYSNSVCSNMNVRMRDTSILQNINNLNLNPVYLYDSATCVNCTGSVIQN